MGFINGTRVFENRKIRRHWLGEEIGQMGKWHETQEAYFGQTDSSEENTGRVLPILFNTEMVQAILDGRKTVTRRVMKPQPLYYTGRRYIFADECCPKKWEDCDNIIETYQYQPGDILYVRETWAFLLCIECMDEGPACNVDPVVYDDGDSESEGCFVYKASHPRPERVSWRPSIHMPKEAARIWLKVTDVRVERLHDMTLDDFLAEGVVIRPEAFNDPENAYMQARSEFARIWDSTTRKSQTVLNPWVWVIEFERCEKPEPCIIRGVEPADDERPCLGYSVSEDDDEPCEMCKGCKVCSGNDEAEAVL